MFEGFPVQSTTEGLGVVSLLTHPDAVELSVSDKSTAFRGRVNGRDLVWRQVDRNGLPKHSNWTLDAIERATETEVRAYCHLRAQWGKLVPELVLRGPDFNQLWVTVTTYEGVSLEIIADTALGLKQSVKDSARQSLENMHAAGVLHGDVELRNAVWREKDGQVLWVDLELARLRVDLAAEEDFDALAAAEMQKLRAQLDTVPTLPDFARARSPKSKKTRIVPCCV